MIDYARRQQAKKRAGDQIRINTHRRVRLRSCRRFPESRRKQLASSSASMNRQLFLRARKIFDLVVDAAPEERESLLSEQCAEDDVLRREVEDLLGLDADAPSQISEVVEAAARGVMGAFRLDVGDRLGHFVVESRLGKGGMGEVYRAKDSKLGRQVALKLLPSNLANNVGLGARFRREAKALPMPTEPLQRIVQPATQVTVRGTVLGTSGFMSPEQIRGDEADARSDIFSLGVVLYGMLTGQQPFSGQSPIDLISSVLRDEPTPMTRFRQDHPSALETAILCCLEKLPEGRYRNARDLCDELSRLRDSQRTKTSSSELSPADKTADYLDDAAVESALRPSEDGAASGAHVGFWIAVLPFRFRGSDPALEGLAEDITEEILTGLSRFSYLRVLARSSTQRYAGKSVDALTVGTELGARYLMEGTLRQAGSEMRLGVRLIETGSGAHIWAENYTRTLDPDQWFELTDDLVARIVSTTADMRGVLPHAMSEDLRSREAVDLTPYEAVLRCFGYIERLTEEEHREVRALIERIAGSARNHADVLAMLSFVHAEEFKHGFNQLPGALDRSLAAARQAVAAGPTNGFAYHVLAQALFFRRELPAFRKAAQRAIELNPMDGGTVAFMGILMAYAGDWESGLQLAQRAMELNPNHPGWYHFSSFWNEYRKGDYRSALDVALRIGLPSYFHYHGVLAMAAGQLGDADTAKRAVEELLVLKPDFAQIARTEWLKWLGEGELLENALEGLRKAGLAMTA